jgi:hypothetical protein
MSELAGVTFDDEEEYPVLPSYTIDDIRFFASDKKLLSDYKPETTFTVGKVYDWNVFEIYEKPTAADLKFAMQTRDRCICGQRVKGVTTFHGSRIMGKFRAVAYHDYDVDHLDSHYTDYWAENHPHALEWWRRGANNPLHYKSRQLLIRGKPPTE